MKFVSTQSQQVYDLLCKKNLLTAKQIGQKLNIFPNAVYRSLKPLIDLGLVTEVNNYPTQFKVQSKQEASQAYLLYFQNNFLNKFAPQDVNGKVEEEDKLQISFIQNRPELLDKTIFDLNFAKQGVNYIVSGLEVPAENVLAFSNALKRGVKLRFIVQRLDEVNRQMLKNWQKMGMEVRFFSLLEARFIVIDNKITHITSYNPDIKDEAVGVRFNYPPIAKLINEIFEKRWLKSKPIL